jgi:hypothetical protein
LSNVWDSRPFIYKEIDVMTLDGKKWRDLYEFDTPVVISFSLIPSILQANVSRFMSMGLRMGKKGQSRLQKPLNSCIDLRIKK